MPARLEADVRAVGRPEHASCSGGAWNLLRYGLIEPLHPGLVRGHEEDGFAVWRHGRIRHTVTVWRRNREMPDRQIQGRLEPPADEHTDRKHGGQTGHPGRKLLPHAGAAQRGRDDDIGRTTDDLIEDAARVADVAQALFRVANETVTEERPQLPGNI